jgi:hypothetical protein
LAAPKKIAKCVIVDRRTPFILCSIRSAGKLCARLLGITIVTKQLTKCLVVSDCRPLIIRYGGCFLFLLVFVILTGRICEIGGKAPFHLRVQDLGRTVLSHDRNASMSSDLIHSRLRLLIEH